MTIAQQQNEIIGDLTTKLALSNRSREQLKDRLYEAFKFTGEEQLDDAISYVTASDYFGFTIFKNRAKEINSEFGFCDMDLKRKYKEMVLQQDFENIDEYIADLIPF